MVFYYCLSIANIDKRFFTVPDNNIERLDHNRLAREMLVLTGSMTLLAWLRFLYCGMRAKLDVEL